MGTLEARDREFQPVGDPVMDLDAYFRRIHYHGDRSPTLETLRSILRLHPQYIPFENLDPVLRIPVRLDLPSVFTKLISNRRGGYCFEQNLVLKAALQSLGFNVRGLAARVVWNRPPDAITARSHMLLLIDMDATRYIADAGFGAVTLTGPLELKAGLAQETPHEMFRLMEAADEFRLEALVRGEWRALYRFGLQEQFPIDYEVASWYLSNHPESHFVTGLIAARVDGDGRHTLRDNEYSIHYLRADTEKKRITDVGELELILTRIFGIAIPSIPNVRPVFERILKSGGPR